MLCDVDAGGYPAKKKESGNPNRYAYEEQRNTSYLLDCAKHNDNGFECADKWL